jgi:murein DD-endopeptidase MepM/ murein hydrolase activator NlpD
MHTLNRLLTLLLLCVVLLPPATFALVSLDQKTEVEDELQDAIGDAVNTYQQRGNLERLKTVSEKTIMTETERMASLEKRKLELRRAIIKERRIVASVGKRYGITIASREALAPMLATEKRRVGRLLQIRSLRQVASNPLDTKNVVLRMAFNVASIQAGEMLLERTQTQMLRDLTAADHAFERLEEVTAEREKVLAEYTGAQLRKQKAVTTNENSTKQLTTIKEIMDDVHTQVLKIQGELARIDARLKEKAERALIEKGLLKAEDIGKSDGSVYRQQFSWPVYGPVSAGFMVESYKKFFGVDHHGMDIVVAQETPIASAADGVVFLVRNGGEKGYSYILIGHRGGYATLYGHVFKSLVKAGDEVTVGQIIALSGGTPGTHGAGPMTTAAHLHFEVIQAGTNVNPKSVLP